MHGHLLALDPALPDPLPPPRLLGAHVGTEVRRGRHRRSSAADGGEPALHRCSREHFVEQRMEPGDELRQRLGGCEHPPLLGSGEYALEVPGQATEETVVRGFEGLDVGERVRVKFLGTDVPRGFIDFAAGDRLTSRRSGNRTGEYSRVLPRWIVLTQEMHH